MIPSVDERLASIVRALTDVVLPALPTDAGLAQEQVHLSLGHLQILRMQLDDLPAFEAEELADARALGAELLDTAGAADRGPLREVLERTAGAALPTAVRNARIEIHSRLADLIASDGLNAATMPLILAAETKRVVKERALFAPFGFDIAPSTA